MKNEANTLKEALDTTSREAPAQNNAPQQSKPCPGDPLTHIEIAPTDANGLFLEGGTFGWTRNNGNKFHDGIDLKAEPGTPRICHV